MTAPADHPLIAAAQALVDDLSDIEANHGGLMSPGTLRRVGELRLQLAIWRRAVARYLAAGEPNDDD